MRFLATPHVTDRRGFLVAGVLIADREYNTPPQHLTVVGAKDDPVAKALFAAAIRQPVIYKRVEWWDKGKNPCPTRREISGPGKGCCVPPHRGQVLPSGLFARETDSEVALFLES